VITGEESKFGPSQEKKKERKENKKIFSLSNSFQKTFACCNFAMALCIPSLGAGDCSES
jgi:hypothetical protein